MKNMQEEYVTKLNGFEMVVSHIVNINILEPISDIYLMKWINLQNQPSPHNFKMTSKIVQCCTFRVRDRKERDNSTIIVFELAPYARERNKEESNTNLPLPRTESHNPPGPQENNKTIFSKYKVVINLKIYI